MKKNILLMIQNLTHGGAERALSRLSVALKDDYHIFFVLFDGTIIDYPFHGQLIDLQAPPRSTAFGKAYTLLRRICRVRKLKKQYQAAATISYLEGANLVNILSKSYGKTIVSIRSNKREDAKLGFYGAVQGLLIKLLYNQADAVVPVSKMLARQMAEDYGIHQHKLRTIYNLYDAEEIINAANAGLEDQHTVFYNNHDVIISIGRLAYQKGFWHLIKVLAKIRQENDRAGLVIVGDGPMLARLRALAAACGIDGHVLFTGYQPNPFKFCRDAKIYVMSSLFEGFPNALVEAMICGLPVISADCVSGPREILYEDPDLSQTATAMETADFGILLPAFPSAEDFDPEVIGETHACCATAVLDLLADEEKRKRYSALARRRADAFTYERCKREYMHIIEK